MVSTTAMAGAAALADFAGAPAPVDLAGTDVPAVARMKFSAVAEVHSSAVDDEGDPLVVRTSRQRSAVVVLDPIWWSVGRSVGPWIVCLFQNLRAFSCWSVPYSGRWFCRSSGCAKPVRAFGCE